MSKTIVFARSATALTAAVLSVALLALAAPSMAADGTYTSEASFVAAAGATSIDSFEALAGRSRSLAPISTGTMTITTGGAPIGVQTGADTPDAGFGAAATDGTHWISVYLVNQPQGSITLSFANPTRSFGLNLMDVGETTGTVVLATNVGTYASGVTLLSFPPTLGNGAVSFVGLTQNTAFTSVTLTVSGIDDAYGLDKVYTSAVPDASSALTLLAGLGAVGAWLRRRSA